MTEREPSIYCDYADIRSRMLGDDKPAPKKSGTWVAEWSNPEVFEISPGLVAPIIGVDPAQPGSDRTVICTRLPQGAWRKLIDGPPLRSNQYISDAMAARIREVELEIAGNWPVK